MSNATHRPYIPASKTIAETTAIAIGLGLLIGIVMTAANTYLGLYAGMTVSASIPAAVISMGILRGILKRGTILENNIVQTIASAGESVAAGIIFTVPALVLTGAWHDFHYWPVTLIGALGGLLGVLFMIPLRRALIVEEEELIYPEGRACAEVLEAGEAGGTGLTTVFQAMGLGMIFKVLLDGISIIKGTVEWATRVGNTVFYLGSDLSPALLGVGFIVGPNVAVLICLGGGIAWLIAIPCYVAATGIGPEVTDYVAYAGGIWNAQIRYMGVGAMVVGGLWSIWSVRNGIKKGISGGFGGVRTDEEGNVPRTEQDMPMKQLGTILVLLLPLIFGLYIYLAHEMWVGLVAGLIMTIAGFFFVAVSSYIVGLVGSSNNPVSGMTICTVLFASGLLLLFGATGITGIISVLGIAGVVCCAACTAGDVSQDLKTGYILGATPKKQQWTQVLGVIVPAFIIAPILIVLHSAYGIGDQLRAPQATLFASLTQTIFQGGTLPWAMIFAGAATGIAIIIIDLVLQSKDSRFRAYVMPVAVGIYLPVSLSVPILVGGILSMVVSRTVTALKGEKAAGEAQSRGVLVSSGLVAGEAITGVILATLIFFKVNLPINLLDSSLVSIVLFAAVAWFLMHKARKEA